MIAIVGLILSLLTSPAIAQDWAEVCGEAADSTKGQIVDLARPYRLYRGVPIFLGPCQINPRSRTRRLIVSEEGCGVRVDASGDFAVQEARSFYIDRNGLKRVVEPCSAFRADSARFPITRSARSCPWTFDLAAGKAWRWRRSAYQKDGVLHDFGPCVDDRVEASSLRATACPDLSFDFGGRDIVLKASRIVAAGNSRGDENEIIACAPILDQAFGDYRLAASREGCNGYLTHRFEIAESFGSARTLLIREHETFIIDIPDRKLVPIARASEGQGCTADIAQAVPQIEMPSGWRHDDDQGQSRPLISIIAATPEAPIVQSKLGELIAHHYLGGAFEFDRDAASLGCAIIKSRHVEWRVFRPDGSTYRAPGPSAEAVILLDRCGSK